MKNIIDYKTTMNKEGKWELVIVTQDQVVERYDVVEYCHLVNPNAKDINDAVTYIFQREQLNLVKDKNYMVDQKVDLNYVRVQMRKIIKNLADDSKSLEEKKENLDVYGTVCNASNILVKTCALELAIDKVTK